MWDTGNSLGELTGHGKRVISAAYRPARPFKLITASEDTRSVFYNGPPFVLDHSNTEHSNWVNCVRYSPDGNTIITVGSDKKVTLPVHTLAIQSWHVDAKVDSLTPSRLRGSGVMICRHCHLSFYRSCSMTARLASLRARSSPTRMQVGRWTIALLAEKGVSCS